MLYVVERTVPGELDPVQVPKTWALALLIPSYSVTESSGALRLNTVKVKDITYSVELAYYILDYLGYTFMIIRVV